MSVPISQMATVASYVVKQKLRGRKRYPLVLMLEPLFRCNLACAGCGKIQYPAQILKKHLSVEQCMAAVDECGAPRSEERRVGKEGRSGWGQGGSRKETGADQLSVS